MKTGYIVEIDDTDNSFLLFKFFYPAESEQEEQVGSTTTRSGAVHREIPSSDDPPYFIVDTVAVMLDNCGDGNND